MAAYNRYDGLFEDGFELDASDLNAFKSDLRAWVLRQLAEFSPSDPGTPPTTTSHVTSRQGGGILSRAGSFLTFR